MIARRLAQWAADDPKSVAVRAVPREFRNDRNDQSDLSDLSDEERWALYARWLESEDAAVRANTLICLIHQTNYLLDQQIAALEAQFVGDGGYSEQLAAARLAERSRRKNDPSDQSDPTDRIPDCPQCGKPMVLRTAKQGRNPGQSFWGCSGHPDCRGVESV